MKWPWTRREKALDSRQPFIGATVTTSDRANAIAYRVRNHDLHERQALASGPAAVWVRLNALAVASAPVRLYRRLPSGVTSTRSVGSHVRKAWASGARGLKAAEMEARGGEFVEVTNHPLLDVLDNPTPEHTALSWRQLRATDLEATGNAFILPVVEGGQLVYLDRLDPGQTVVIPNDGDGDALIVGYRYGRESHRAMTLSARDVLHYRYFAGDDPYLGKAWVDDVATPIRVLMANEAYMESFIQNGMLPQLHADVADENITPEQFEQLKEQAKANYGGVNNWGGMFWTTHKVKLSPLSVKQTEFQTLEQLNRFERQIRNAAGVPESLAELNEANLASSLTGNAQYIRQTVAPRVQMLCDQDTALLLSLYDDDDFFFAPDELVPEEQANILAMITQAASVLTVNERRQALGYDQLEGEEGDELGTPTPASPSLFTLSAKSASVPSRKVDDQISGGDVTATIERLATEAEREAQAWYRTLEGRATRRGDAVEIDEAAQQDLFDRLKPILDQIRTEGARLGAAQLGRGSVAVPPVPDDYVASLVRSVTGTARDQLTTIVRAGIEAGRSDVQITGDIRAGIDTLSGYGANRLARTETALMVGEGRQEAWKELGVTRKQWNLAPNSCPMCAGFDRQYGGRKVVNIGEPFARAGEVVRHTDGKTTVLQRDILHEPLHPNCRCGTVPVVEDDE